MLRDASSAQNGEAWTLPQRQDEKTKAEATHSAVAARPDCAERVRWGTTACGRTSAWTARRGCASPRRSACAEPSQMPRRGR
eukprot:scaffold1272_cov250-Pinguiococcus_pyrenoidosus.AAC.22